MTRATFFITGTDTGVGKTVLTALLAALLRQAGRRVAVCKPVCSGGREDARLLADALGGDFTLDEINPWHFAAPIAPVLAARRERQRVTRSQIVAHARQLQKRCEILLVEGAGGLLSPLAEETDSRDLIAALRATPIIVGSNQLGVVNHLRLTLAALPPRSRVRAKIVLMSPEHPDDSTSSNMALLTEYFERNQITELPWLRVPMDLAAVAKTPVLRQRLSRVLS